MASGRTVKVAVIGTGLAGLTAAYLLAKACEGDQVNFEVHLFEKARDLTLQSFHQDLAMTHIGTYCRYGLCFNIPCQLRF